MKSATKTAFIVVLIALAVAIGWWLSSPKKTPTPIVATPNPVPTVAPATTSPLIQSDTPPEIVQPHARTPYLGLKDSRWIERRRLREEDAAYQWRTPIEFFGKVIDEQKQPVVGASIDVAWSGTVEKYGGDGVGKRTLTSDANGMFTLAGVEGKGITVRVAKDGYHVPSESNMQWFEYAGFWEPTFIEPDRNKPVIFRLVKRPVAEPTLRVRQRSIPTAPSWAKNIDLLAQPAETSGGGDMTLRIVRPPSPGYQNPFDWELKIEGTSGAEFVESKDEFMLRAPDHGYQKSLSMTFKQARGNSIETIKFYVRNQARKLYAAVSVEVTPYYPNHATKEDAACFIVTGTVNPNDSPNVEYDPEKDIREMAKK
jgi:hypothetical protein